MSISNLLDPTTATQTWKALQVNTITVKGLATFDGSTLFNSTAIFEGDTEFNGAFFLTGNQTIVNDGPFIELINDSLSVNRATLSLKGASNVAPARIQQDNGGTLILENTHNGNIDFFLTGNTHLKVFGNNYPVGPYPLYLDASNNIIKSPAIVEVTQADNIGTAVLVNSLNGVIKTKVANAGIQGTNFFQLINNTLKTTSNIFLSLQEYSGNGSPVLNVSAINLGTCNIIIKNLGNAGLDDDMIIGFTVIN